jgi:hypothetical protein
MFHLAGYAPAKGTQSVTDGAVAVPGAGPSG